MSSRTLRTGVVLALALGLAVFGGNSCGGNAGPASNASGEQAGPPSCKPQQAGATPAPAGAFVGLGQVTIRGKTCTVLTDSQGHTLYYYTPDTVATAACTGTCLQTWRPLHITSDPPPMPWLTGHVTRSSDAVVLYNGHRLYRYTPEDSKHGTADGEGINNQWHVVTPDLA